MFFVSLLLNQLLGWMRAQQGSSSLRAIFYMDEIFGYLPPTAMPPSKKPMMVLLKQARAFGLGILLATQNPADLDYKALANIGTWWLGRLQTERDKMRVLDGLEGAANTAGGKFDRQLMERTLAGLGARVFLMNNVQAQGLADAFAQRIGKLDGTPEEKLSQAYQLAFGREPTQKERDALFAFWTRFPHEAAKNKAIPKESVKGLTLATFCQALFASAEFRYIN
jgi:hypothetical protein